MTNPRLRLLAGSMLASALSATFAHAATPPPRTEPSVVAVEEVVVTGSRIPQINEKSANPISVLTGQEAKLQGATHVEDLLNTLPQVNAGLNGGALGPTGTATVDLRGFGAFRTLVLMNGRRLNPGDPINPSADLNSVPAALIKRVEVLTGGASSVYGSDAIAGVVNFVMDGGFTGLRLDAQYSLFQSGNSDSRLQDLARANGANPAHGNRYDGPTVDLSATFGADIAQGDGHVTGYLGYRRTRPILAANRDYSACNLIETATYFGCIRDDNTSPAQFQLSDGQALTLDQATGNSLRPYDGATDGYNTAGPQNLQRSDTRYDAGLFADYRFSDAAKAYLEFQYTDDSTTAQYEPASTALNTFGVNCNNPLLSAAEVGTFCTGFGLGPADTAQIVLGKRNVEGQPRSDAFHHKSYRFVLGLKGKIDDAWSYDVFGQYGLTRATVVSSNDLSLTKLGRALNVVSVGGVATCQSVVDATDPSCVPYNVFSIGGVTPAAVNYISGRGEQSGYASRAVLNGVLIGQLGRYGLKSPWSDEGVGVALGVEYRREALRNTPNAALTSGDLSVYGQQRPFGGAYTVSEVFGEAHVPLLEDKPFARKLSLDLSDRYAKYSLQGGVNAYKIGGDWTPTDGLRFRGSYSQAIRAPNGYELFKANTIAKFQGADPCAGATPTATLAQCQNSGLTAAQYGTLTDTGNFNFLTGGNRHLSPETANTFTIGAVLTPLAIQNFSVSVDYWHIEVQHYDGQYAPNASLNNCINTGNPIFCALVQRDAGGSISLGNGITSGRVIATNLNTGSFEESGVDFDSNYAFDLADFNLPVPGRLSAHFVGSLALDNRIQPIPGGQTFDCTGLFGPTCTGEGPTSPIPKWRHQLRLTWAAPEVWQVSLNWRHIGRLKSELGSSYAHLAGTPFAVDSQIKPYDYFDLTTSIRVSSRVTMRAGMDNIFGRTPPVIGASANPLVLGGNMAASMYDTLGRYMFVSFTGEF